MSFRCQNCNEPGPDRTRPQTVVTEIRRIQYPIFGDEIPGWEIVKERKLCEICAEKTEDVGDTLRIELKPFVQQKSSQRAIYKAKHRADEAIAEAA